MSVKVAVRVRPFIPREINLGAECCIKMVSDSLPCQNGPTTEIIDPKTKQSKPFTFDYSFWSHDGYDTDESGYCKPVSSKYADQLKVYESLGRQVLDNAWEGYHCCLFAYGQTGSGKSYSMIGNYQN